jgi:hypothetical protein
MSDDRYQAEDAFQEWQKQRARRVVKNEQAFRAYNERRERFERPTLVDGETAPFVCECADDSCWGTLELTPDEFEAAHGEDDHFTVLPGHVMPEFETVTDRREHYWVVAKFTPEEVEQRLVTDQPGE